MRFTRDLKPEGVADVTTITQKCYVLEAVVLLLLMSDGQCGFFLHESLLVRIQMAWNSHKQSAKCMETISSNSIH